MNPDTTSDIQPADESTAAPTTNPVIPSPTKSSSDAPLLPHAASSALSTASDAASNVVSAAASTLKTAVDEALAWTEAKVDKLSAKQEDGTGPYGSVSTCALSDLDPIGQGVLPAITGVKKEGEAPVNGEDAESEDGKEEENGKGEEKLGETTSTHDLGGKE